MIAPKLRFSEFKDEWIEKKLESIADLTSSKRVHLSDYAPSGIPFFRGKEITELKAGKKPTDVLYISNEQFEQIKSKYGVPKNGEMLITAVGTLANSYLVNLDYDFYFKDGNLIWFKNITEVPEFLELLLDAKKNDVLNSSIGSTQRALTILNLNKLKFYFPSKEEQTKIAEFLSTVDDKISQLSRQLELLNQYKKGVMQKIFSQEIRFKNDNGEDFGEWDLVTLGEITTDMQSGLSRKLNDSDTGLVVLRSNNIDKNSLDFTDIKYWYKEDPQGANVKNYLLEDGDILVNFINSLSQIGKTAIFYNKLNRDIICTTNILRLKVDKKRALNTFINFIFQTEEYINYIQSITKPAVNQASFTTKEFKLMEINLPTIQEQKKIAEFLTAIDERIDHTTAQLTHTKQWKKGLLQQMFV